MIVWRIHSIEHVASEALELCVVVYLVLARVNNNSESLAGTLHYCFVLLTFCQEH